MRHQTIINFVFLLVVASGCQKNSLQIIGDYSVCDPTAYDRFIYNTRGVQNTVAGSSLSLKADSTFVYATCGNVMTGKWQTNNQVLRLFVTHNKYQIDSLNITHICLVPKEPLEYEMNGNKLYKVLQFSSGASLELLSKK